LFDSNQTLYNKECFVSKHHLVTKRILCSAEKNLSSACSMLATSIANMLLLMLTTWSQKSKALVVEHFGMCSALCDLHRILETYLRAAAAQVVSVVLPQVLQSELLCDKDKGMCIIISFFIFMLFF
jgi:hypothetical protein